MVFDQIAKAAESGHGITLQPIQVQEVLETIAAIQAAGMEQAARLKMAVQIIETVIRTEGGTLELTQADLIASEEGFWMRNVAGVVSFGLGLPPEEEVVEAEIVEDTPLSEV